MIKHVPGGSCLITVSARSEGTLSPITTLFLSEGEQTAVSVSLREASPVFAVSSAPAVLVLVCLIAKECDTLLLPRRVHSLRNLPPQTSHRRPLKFHRHRHPRRSPQKSDTGEKLSGGTNTMASSQSIIVVTLYTS